MKRPKALIFFLGLPALLMLLSSCPDKSNEITASAIHLTAEGSDFRGVNIGDSPGVVSSTEFAKSVYTMPDELIYRIEVDKKDSAWYEINYGLGEEGLNNIELSVFMPKGDQATSLKNEFRALYSERYGECHVHDEFCSWSTITSNGKNALIYLKEPVIVADKMKLVVQFREATP